MEIRTPDGVTEAVLYSENSPKPGVLFLTDIGGIRESQRGMAKRVAELGYTVLMPNIFYRVGRPPLFDFPRTPGDERTMKRFAELVAPLTPEALDRDVAAYVDFFAAQDCVKKGPMGVVGYCYSGSVAMRAAAARPEKITVAASFHGGRLYVDGPASPHLLLPRIKARLYFGHAVKDPTMTAEAIEKFDAALKAWGGKFQSEIYEGALHSWAIPDSPVYNQPQAERAFQKLVALLGETLGGS